MLVEGAANGHLPLSCPAPRPGGSIDASMQDSQLGAGYVHRITAHRHICRHFSTRILYPKFVYLAAHRHIYHQFGTPILCARFPCLPLHIISFTQRFCATPCPDHFLDTCRDMYVSRHVSKHVRSHACTQVDTSGPDGPAMHHWETAVHI